MDTTAHADQETSNTLPVLLTSESCTGEDFLDFRLPFLRSSFLLSLLDFRLRSLDLLRFTSSCLCRRRFRERSRSRLLSLSLLLWLH